MFDSANNSILETIGNTPIIRLDAIKKEGAANLYGKYEAGNPSYSVKDRIALAIIEDTLKKEKITPDTELVAATAGNSGVAFSLVAAVKKLKLTLFMPEGASLERRKMFEGFGAKLVITPQKSGVKEAIAKAKEYCAADSNRHFIFQFDHPKTVFAHQQTTAQEIIKDFPGGIDAFVTGIGTGGTLMGVGGALKEKFPHLKIVVVEPSRAALLSGQTYLPHRIEQIGLGFLPKNLKRDLIDEIIQVKDSEAYMTTRRISRKLGLLVGISSGANVAGALEVANRLGPDKKVLTFLCDAGQRYFSVERFFKKSESAGF